MCKQLTSFSYSIFTLFLHYNLLIFLQGGLCFTSQREYTGQEKRKEEKLLRERWKDNPVSLGKCLTCSSMITIHGGVSKCHVPVYNVYLCECWKLTIHPFGFLQHCINNSCILVNQIISLKISPLIAFESVFTLILLCKYRSIKCFPLAVIIWLHWASERACAWELMTARARENELIQICCSVNLRPTEPREMLLLL